MGRLQGKTAIVTGAGQGIGAAVAHGMAAEGASVWVTDLNVDTAEGVAAAIIAAGGDASAHQLDVTSESGWRELAEAFGNKRQGLDILVHNAGMEWVVPFEDIRLEDWHRVMAVNVDSVFLGTQCLLPQLKVAGTSSEAGASLINISSIAGQVGYPDQAAYNTSKAAVRHLSKSLAIEFAAHGYNIRVNSIHPGCVETPMLHEAMEAWASAEVFGTSDIKEVRTQVAALHPLNKLARPEDIAAGVIYLAADEARFVTGAELNIDGGWVAR